MEMPILFSLGQLRLLACLACFLRLSGCYDCWPRNISVEPAIGFDLSLTYGTVVAVFSNGTFANIAHIDADVAYQARMLQTMRDALADETFGSVNDLSDRLASRASGKQKRTIPKRMISSLQEVFGRLLSPIKITDAPDSVASNTLNSTATIVPEMPFLRLIGLLKEAAEEYLGSTIRNVTISFPVFFGPLQVLLLDNTLEQASLFDPVCRANHHSISSAAIAYRRAAYGDPKSSLDCVYGRFGVETVITFEYTEAALTMSSSILYVGENSSWQRHGFRTVISRSLSNQDPHCRNGQEDTEFWKKVRSCLRALVLPGPGVDPGETFNRLVLTGTLAYDLDLLHMIRDSLGPIIPPENPQVISIFRTVEDVATANDKYDEIRRKSGLSCLLYDSLSDDIIRRYETGLLDSVRQNQNKVMIDPVFAAARGAALLNLESRIVPCKRDLEGPWELEDFPRSELQFYLRSPKDLVG